jgi:hypothetical protein
MPQASLVTRSRTQLPQELSRAQSAINLPEVQEMLQKLSAFNLGIFMPHRHEDETGAFEVLPQGIIQLEDGLRVSFVEEHTIADPESYVPVGWVWNENGAVSSAMCVMRCFKRDGDTMHYSRHESE